jgi:hypothetical protein
MPTARAVDAKFVHERFDAVFAAQPVDWSWARNEERTLADFASKVIDSGSRLEKVECHESLCRTRLSFKDANAHDAFLTHIGAPPFDHGGFFQYDPESGVFSLFTARAGRALPSFEPELAGN